MSGTLNTNAPGSGGARRGFMQPAGNARRSGLRRFNLYDVRAAVMQRRKRLWKRRRAYGLDRPKASCWPVVLSW